MDPAGERLRDYYQETREKILKKETRCTLFTGLLPGDEGENIKEGNPLGSDYGVITRGQGRYEDAVGDLWGAVNGLTPWCEGGEQVGREGKNCLALTVFSPKPAQVSRDPR